MTTIPCVAAATVDNAGIMTRQLGRSLVVVALLLCGACVSTQPSASSFSVRRVTAPRADSVFQAASATLLDQGYRLDLAHRQAGRLTTHPIEYRPENAPSRFSTAKSDRRLAEIRIQRAGDAATIYCRVIVQRQTTAVYRLLAVDGSGDDRPQQTPIEREAATAGAQNTVWQTIGRDLPRERAILADVLARIAAPAAAGP